MGKIDMCAQHQNVYDVGEEGDAVAVKRWKILFINFPFSSPICMLHREMSQQVAVCEQACA